MQFLTIALPGSSISSRAVGRATRLSSSASGGWIVSRLGCAVVAMSMVLASCGDSPSLPTGGQSTLSVASPGSTLPLGTAVSVNANGTYNLPAQAATITVRCFGRVTVTFTQPGGGTQNNTCQSAGGSANQTNSVNGVASVMFGFDAGASAEVTVW